MKDVNTTYNLYFENAPSGVMKQSGMVINLLGKTIKQPVMKVNTGVLSLVSVLNTLTNSMFKTFHYC